MSRSNGSVAGLNLRTLLSGGGAFAATGGFISFSPNNSEAVRILKTGEVGIGMSGPDRRLDVLDSSAPQLRLTQADGTVYTDFQTSSTGDLTIAPSGGDVKITGALTTTGDAQIGGDFDVTGEMIPHTAEWIFTDHGEGFGFQLGINESEGLFLGGVQTSSEVGIFSKGQGSVVWITVTLDVTGVPTTPDAIDVEILEGTNLVCQLELSGLTSTGIIREVEPFARIAAQFQSEQNLWARLNYADSGLNILNVESVIVTVGVVYN
jgi:hypothetical protein